MFVTVGAILDGTVAPGQRVWMPDEFDAEVLAVESLLLSASTGTEQPALVFRPRDDSERTRWNQLPLKGLVLELRDPTEPVPVPLGVGNVPWSDGKLRPPPTLRGEYPRASE